MKIDLPMKVTFVHAKVHVSVETCATNEDKNIAPDSFVLLFLFLFLFCFVLFFIAYPLITNSHTSH